MYLGPCVFVYPSICVKYYVNRNIVNVQKHKLHLTYKSFLPYKYYIENNKINSKEDLQWFLTLSISIDNFDLFTYLVDKGVEVSTYIMEFVTSYNKDNFFMYLHNKKKIPNVLLVENMFTTKINSILLKYNVIVNNIVMYHNVFDDNISNVQLLLTKGFELPYEELMETVDIALDKRSMKVLYYLHSLKLIDIQVYERRLRMKDLSTKAKRFCNSYGVKTTLCKL